MLLLETYLSVKKTLQMKVYGKRLEVRIQNSKLKTEIKCWKWLISLYLDMDPYFLPLMQRPLNILGIGISIWFFHFYHKCWYSKIQQTIFVDTSLDYKFALKYFTISFFHHLSLFYLSFFHVRNFLCNKKLSFISIMTYQKSK